MDNLPITERVYQMKQSNLKQFAIADTYMSEGEPSEYKLPPWLKQAQVMVPGNLIVGEPFDSIPPPPPTTTTTTTTTPPTVGVPLPVQSTVSPSQSKPPESSTLLTTAPLVINGLLVATVALIMIVRPQMQEIQRNSQQAKEIQRSSQQAEETNVQAGDSSEALGVLVVFLIASAIYISPYLRKYVPPTVRLIGGIMIGIIFNLALKYMV
jgi:hypothetical protein